MKTSKNVSVNTNPKKIDEILTKAVDKIYPSKDALRKVLLSGKRIRLYTGIDPTANFLHMGHMIWMRKHAEFQELGHEVIFLIGGFTAMIGDPDKKYTRVPLTKEQVEANFKDYKNQAKLIMDFDKKENPIAIKNNYDWLAKVKLEEWLSIMSHASLQQFMGHEMFRIRQEKGLSIRLHELCYPLLQAYDSVHMDVDLQIGGSDQTFNMLMSRSLMAEMKNKEQYVMTLKLLTDSSGAKMGKTTSNAISFMDNSNEVFGKVMSFSDNMILLGFELCTDANMAELAEIANQLKDPGVNPMNLKKQLGIRITTAMYGKQAAEKAEKHFEHTVQKGAFAEEAINVKVKSSEPTILDLLVEIKAVPSKSEGKRLIEQKAVEIDCKVISDKNAKVDLSREQSIKVGKRGFYKISLK